MTVGFLPSAVQRQNGGLAQVGLWFPDSFYDVWAVDMTKQALGILSANASDSTWPSLLNSDGYPTAMPNGGGATWIYSEVYIYGNAGDVWVLDWTGGATIAMTAFSWPGSQGMTESIISSTRREYTLTGTPSGTIASFGNLPGGLMKVSVTTSAITSPITKIRLYRKNDENALNSGGAPSIFTSEFLNRVKNFGVIRFMDWFKANNSRCYRSAYMPAESAATWAGGAKNSAWFYGLATVSGNHNTYTVSTLPSLTYGLPVQFMMPSKPTRLTVSSVTKGSPTQFTVTAHGLSNGDRVAAELFIDGGGSWTTAFSSKVVATGLPPDYAVTVIDANTITLPIDSTGFANPGSMNLIPTITISDGTTSKRCLRMGLNNSTNSEWAGTYPRFMTAVYDSTFDVFIISGDVVDFYVGAPLSAMLTLAKYCKAHPWIVLPYAAGDDMWTAVATQEKAALAGVGLIPRNESGNEIWNPGPSFSATQYAQSIAAKTYGTTGFGQTAYDLAYAKRFNEVCDLIEAVYGTGSDWQMILGCQQTNLGTNRLQGNATINGGNAARYPANRADRVATAPYTNPIFGGFGGNAVNYPGLLDQVDNYNQGGSSRNTAFAWLTAEMSTSSTLGWQASSATLDTAIGYMNSQAATITGAGYTGRHGTGLPQTHYEGGPTQFQGSNFTSAGFPANAPTSGRSVTYANLENFWLDWLGSTYAGQYMRSHMTRMAAAGIEYPSQYVIAGPWKTDFTTNQGLYNMNNVLSSAVPAFTELVNWNNGQ